MTSFRAFILSNNFKYLFYGVWFLLALWQAQNTELLSDEAYYWKYSQFLDWGYFDHPPMVALLIKFGSILFDGELGVRLCFVILGTLTIGLIQKMIQPNNKLLFYVISSSIGLLYFTSFLALPDTPLLFFTALFFLLLKRYLNHKSVSAGLMLGITTACLLLSKYHGFVIVLMALLSNLDLLRKGSFYIIIATALLLVLPHFMWQLYHDFPSIQYHFHDRNLNAYRFSNSINYLGIQFVLFGPFIGFFLWYAFFKSKIQSKFDKTLFWQVNGTLFFFFLLTFNGEVQGHWTGILVIPLLYFGYHFFENHGTLRKWVYYQWPIAVILVLLVKIGLVFNLPLGKQISGVFDSFKGRSNWAQSIQKVAKDTPVVFMNSYQNASVYSFYSRKEAITISNVMSRKNQYDLWQYEDSLRGKAVVVIPNYIVDSFDTIKNLEPFTQFAFVSNFQHYGQVELIPLSWQNEQLLSDSLYISVAMKNRGNFSFLENRALPSHLSYTYFEDNHFLAQFKSKIKLGDSGRDPYKLHMKLPDKKGTYQVYFSIQTGWLPPSLNSKVYELTLN